MTDARAVNDAADATLCLHFGSKRPLLIFVVRSILLDASLKRQRILDPDQAPSELLSTVWPTVCPKPHLRCPGLGSCTEDCRADRRTRRGVRCRMNFNQPIFKSSFLEPLCDIHAHGHAQAGQRPGTPRGVRNDALQVPLGRGHSLMDWMRLNSAQIATTPVRVTPSELSRHCFEDDAWMALRGRVYNVTNYMWYHPGGRDQVCCSVRR